MTRRLIPDPPPGLRERRRADGTTRIWWEPTAAARALGFAPVELDEKRLTWSKREADKLVQEVAAAQKTGRRAIHTSGARSIEALVENYQRSSGFRRRAVKTQDSYRKQFKLIVDKWGPYSATDFTKPVMHEWYETLLELAGEYTAISRLRHMSILFAHAELIGWRGENTNPCARLKMAVPKGRRRVLSWAEFDALLAAADAVGLPSIGTACALSMLQGQRQTDIRLATCGAFGQRTAQLLGWATPRTIWVWQLVRSKRGNAGAMVLHDECAPRIAAAIEAARARVRTAIEDRTEWADALDGEPLLVDERSGQPYTGPRAEDLFQRRWGAVKDAAIEAALAGGNEALAEGLRELQFRDLRRSFGVHSRSGGASKDDTADVLGNSAATDQLLADIYMAPSFETASRAVLAMQRPATPGIDERKKA